MHKHAKLTCRKKEHYKTWITVTTGISYYRRLGKIVGTMFQAICAALLQVDTMNRQSGAFIMKKKKTNKKICKLLTPTTSNTPTNFDNCEALS